MAFKTVLLLSLCCILIFGLGLGITSTVLGAIKPGNCDVKDPGVKLDVGQYLIGAGVTSIIFSVVMCVLIISMFCCCMENAAGVGISMAVVTFIYALFGLAWFIVGGVILFRSNIDCIRDKSSHVIYALVFWCLQALHIVQSLCSHARPGK